MQRHTIFKFLLVVFTILFSCATKGQVRSKHVSASFHPLNTGLVSMEWVKKSGSPTRINTVALGAGTSELLTTEQGFGYGFTVSTSTQYIKPNRLNRGVHLGASLTISSNSFGIGPFLGYRNGSIKGSRWGYHAELHLLAGGILDDDYYPTFISPFPSFGLLYQVGSKRMQ